MTRLTSGVRKRFSLDRRGRAGGLINPLTACRALTRGGAAVVHCNDDFKGVHAVTSLLRG